MRATRGESDLVRLTQAGDDLLEADFVGQIELGRAEGVGFEAECCEPLEHIQRGHRGAIGEIHDGMGRGEENPPWGRGATDGTRGSSDGRDLPGTRHMGSDFRVAATTSSPLQPACNLKNFKNSWYKSYWLVEMRASNVMDRIRLDIGSEPGACGHELPRAGGRILNPRRRARSSPSPSREKVPEGRMRGEFVRLPNRRLSRATPLSHAIPIKRPPVPHGRDTNTRACRAR